MVLGEWDGGRKRREGMKREERERERERARERRGCYQELRDDMLCVVCLWVYEREDEEGKFYRIMLEDGSMRQ